MQFNYRYRLLVVIIDANVYVYKCEKNKLDPTFLSFQAKNIFICNSKVRPMTELSGAGDKIDFDGNTFLLECEDIEYVYISELEIFKFMTDDKNIYSISLMDNNIIPYTFAVGENYTYFLSSHYKFIQNDKIGEGTLINATNDSSDPFDYHLGKCGVDSLKTLEHAHIHTFYPHEEDEENECGDLVEEDEENEDLIETNYCKGTNEVVTIFNQKCLICYENDSVYAFKQCGHQCICENCYQIRGDIDLLKGVVFRT